MSGKVNENFYSTIFLLVVVGMSFLVTSQETESPQVDAQKQEMVVEESSKSWKASTIMVIAVFVGWLIGNIVCCSISIRKIINDRKIIKEKIKAKERADSFKKKTPLDHMKNEKLKPTTTDRKNISYKPVNQDSDIDEGIDGYNPRPGSSPNRTQYTGARRISPDRLSQELDNIDRRNKQQHLGSEIEYIDSNGRHEEPESVQNMYKQRVNL